MTSEARGLSANGPFVEAVARAHHERSAVYRENQDWEDLPLAYRLNRLYEMRWTLAAAIEAHPGVCGLSTHRNDCAIDREGLAALLYEIDTGRADWARLDTSGRAFVVLQEKYRRDADRVIAWFAGDQQAGERYRSPAGQLPTERELAIVAARRRCGVGTYRHDGDMDNVQTDPAQAREGDAWVITFKGVPYAAIYQADRFRDHGGSWRAADLDAARLIWRADNS